MVIIVIVIIGKKLCNNSLRYLYEKNQLHCRADRDIKICKQYCPLESKISSLKTEPKYRISVLRVLIWFKRKVSINTGELQVRNILERRMQDAIKHGQQQRWRTFSVFGVRFRLIVKHTHNLQRRALSLLMYRSVGFRRFFSPTLYVYIVDAT